MQIADYAVSSCSFGKSKKFVLWLQGCVNNCENCISPEWKDLDAGQTIDNEKIFALIRKSGLREVVISGGEPLLQYDKLITLLEQLKKSGYRIILYTGFHLNKVKKKYNTILESIDVLIAGPYIESLNNGRGLRGSTNQKVFMLTDFYESELDDFKNGLRTMEIKIGHQYIMYIGIPPKSIGGLF